MGERFVQFIRKQWLLLWCFAVLAALTAMAVSASYPASTLSIMERVVVASTAVGKMFSSNYLEEGGELSYQAKYCTELTQQEKDAHKQYEADFFIYNYSLSNIGTWYSKVIEYDLELRLTDAKGNILDVSKLGDRKVRLLVNGVDSGIELSNATPLMPVKLSSQKLGEVANSEFTKEDFIKYTLCFSSDWDLDKDTELCIQVCTKLKNKATNYSDLEDIARVIGLKRSVYGESKGWQSSLKEKDQALNHSNVDAYNLVLTGSGRADIQIKWKPDKIVINQYICDSTTYREPYNYSEVEYTSASDAEGGNPVWSVMTIHANTGSVATKHRNRYDIQLYRKENPGNYSFYAGHLDTKNDTTDWIQVTITPVNG